MVHASLLERKVIHVDMDAFYASVEIRDNPSLKGKPVIVGGSPEGRGVVTTCSYEARKFGVRSAMSCAQAYRRCPQAIFIRPRFEKYKAASDVIREIFHEHASLVEPMSLDEAYLDVTGATAFASQIASVIRRQVKERTGLTCSAGVAPNKLVAKIASDFRKPDGLTVVSPERVHDFMRPLSVRKISGVGPKFEERLNQKGIFTCAQLESYGLERLTLDFGNSGPWLWARAQGIDPTPVGRFGTRKSLGSENTFPKDLTRLDEIQSAITEIAEEVFESVTRRQLQGRTVTLKVKYSDFTTITRRHTSNLAPATADELRAVGHSLLQHTEAGRRPIRLLGLTLSNFGGEEDDAPEEKEDPNGTLF